MVQKTNVVQPWGGGNGEDVESRMVCTAHQEVRLSCIHECSSCSCLTSERRRSSVKERLLAFPERRCVSNILPVGYDLALADGSVLPDRNLSRQLPLALMGLLLTFNILDVFLTLRAFSMGVAEANPIMADLFHLSLPMGMLFKFFAVSTGALLLWKYRHLPIASRGMNFLTVCYGAVVAYHLVFQIGIL